jgi:flagellar hook assembly protein FlgD
VLDIAALGRVQLAVYDVTGELVTTLMDGEYAAGRYEVTWGGRDNSGLSVASGVYFCRLRVGSLSVTRKMVLVH